MKLYLKVNEALGNYSYCMGGEIKNESKNDEMFVSFSAKNYLEVKKFMKGAFTFLMTSCSHLKVKYYA